MTEYRNKYLEVLKARPGGQEKNLKSPQVGNCQNCQNPPEGALSKLQTLSKPSFGSFGSAQVGAFSENHAPPLDAEGTPCGLCPTCNLGEFWQRPRSHPDYDPRDWRCLRCRPILAGAGQYMTFCGVPDGKAIDYPPTEGPICAHCGGQDEPGNTVWTTATYGVPLHTGCEEAWLKKGKDDAN